MREIFQELRRLGPKLAGHPSIGTSCTACQKKFVAGDYTTLVNLGPGDDAEGRQRARAGLAHNAVAVEVHWACATGEE